MAHECPDCGMTCYCGGDIEDCCNNYPKYVMKCNHFQECQRDDDKDDLESEYCENV